MRVNDKFSNCEFCKRRFNQCENCNPNYKATDSFELDEKAYYDERRIRQDERNKIITLIKKNKEQFDSSINSQLYKNEEEKQNYKHSIDDYLYLLIEKIREEQ